MATVETITTRRLDAVLADLIAKAGFQYVALATITLLGAGLRLYRLGEWSFWIDEISTIGRAQAHFDPTILATYWQPPSLLLIGSALHFLGVGEWSARLAPALIGVITIPILYFPIRRISGTAVALIASLLLAVAPWHIYWSQNARFYAAVLLFYSLAYFIFYLAIEEDRPLLILLSLLMLFLAFRERVFALFFAPVAVSYLLLLKLLPFELPAGYRRRNLLLFLLPGIAYLIYTAFSFATGANPPIVDTIRGFWGRAIDDPARILILVTFNIGLPLATLAIFGGVYLLLEKSRLALYLMLGAVVPPLLLAAANPFFFTVDRYVFVSLTSWVVLAAVAIKTILTRFQGRAAILGFGILGLLLVDAAGAHLMYYQINNGNRLDWRGALQLVEGNRLQGETVVSTRRILAEYYLDEEVTDLRDFDPQTATQSEGRTWFVVDSEGLGHTSVKAKEWMESNGELVDVNYLRVRENINIRIYVYDPDSGTAMGFLEADPG